jgi:hypothetical protein
MNPTVPEWLTLRNGNLRRAVNGQAWVVCFDDQPQYIVTPVPVGGKHGSDVIQSINGKRVATKGTFATEEEAIRGGLEDLRAALGW